MLLVVRADRNTFTAGPAIAVIFASGTETSAVAAEPMGAIVEGFPKGTGFFRNPMSPDSVSNSRWTTSKFAGDCFKRGTVF